MHEFGALLPGRVSQQVISGLCHMPLTREKHVFAAFFVGQVGAKQLFEFDEFDGAVDVPLGLLQRVHAVLDRHLRGERRWNIYIY